MKRKLLLHHQKPIQLLLSWFGAFVGLFLTLITLQYFMDFRDLLSVKNDWLHPEYLVVSKKVTVFNSIGGAKGFDEAEIDALKNIASVERVEPFERNLFRASGSLASGMAPGLDRSIGTELFFESIPDDMLDVRGEAFHWEEGSRTVPAVIPADYLRLYNFGFAPGQALPQVSPATLESVAFTLGLDSMGHEVSYTAKIVGFSDRIQSVLVPRDFLHWANRAFTGSSEGEKPARLILQVKDPTDSELLYLLEQKGYDTNSELLRNARLSNVLRFIAGLVIAVAVLIILLSLMGFLQYTQLSVQRSAYEIRTLLDLGYPPGQLFRYLGKYMTLLIGSISVLAFVLVYGLKMLDSKLLSPYRIELEEGLRSEVFLTGLLIFVFFLAIQLAGIRKSIYRLGA